MSEHYNLLIIALLVIIIIIILRNSKLKKNFLEEMSEKEKAIKIEMSEKEKTIKKEVSEKEKAIKKQEITAKELEQQKIENLRFSLNPHSFKNTLQTVEHLSKKAYDSVHSLSDIFDYMLYDAKSQLVPLEQEIAFAIQYLKLYSLNLKPTTNVIKSIDQNHLNEWGDKKRIAPLIFAHFIENAFKHGDLNSPDSFIQIIVGTIDNNTLIYSVRNKISEKKSKRRGGLGNKNFEDRLSILYKNNFEYDYSISADNVYTANLKLTVYDY